ncbi:MAG: ribose-5-phosphate isomerase [Propionibacterium sp.]|nr:ribose-5-phosphate isomerase [Propionibacterium sp.]
MRVHIGTDHAAFELKEYLVEHLRAEGFEVIDHGAATYDSQDDYPDYIIPAAEAVAADEGSLGIVLGGSGNGEQIAANKVKGIRAVLADRVELAELGREHNDARCIAMGGRFVTPELGLEIARVFLTTPFSGDERHARRIAKLDRYEQTGSLEA